MKLKLLSISRNDCRSVISIGFILSLIFLVFCGQHKQKKSPLAPVQGGENQHPPTAPSLCDILKGYFNESTSQLVAPVRTEHIERQFQRVLRHDCAGNLQSDKIETIRSPHLDLNLKNLRSKAIWRRRPSLLG